MILTLYISEKEVRMEQSNNLKGRIESREKKRREKQRMNTILFFALFFLLVTTLFFVYDIFLGVLDAAEPYEPPEEIVDPIPIEGPDISRVPITDFVAVDKKLFLVHLYVDGKYHTVSYTVGEEKTVSDLLDLFGISLGKNDEINYSVTTELKEDMVVKIGRITYKTLKTVTTIPYDTIQVPCVFTVFSGKKKMGVLYDGENGERTTTTRVTYVDGVEVDRTVIGEKITKKPVSATIYVDRTDLIDYGNGAPKEGEYIRVIEGEFTAYCPTSGGGKTTRTGHYCRVGYVAVDKDVIPLYSKLYITVEYKGKTFVYGYCYAMDTGGAIKNNIVDLYLPSDFDMHQFGRLYGKIYIITEGKDPDYNYP